MATPGETDTWDVAIVGGGPAGLSAAIYLQRGLRRTLVIDEGRSLAQWEPDVQNFLGFPEGIPGPELLRRARAQAERFGTSFAPDRIARCRREPSGFVLEGSESTYSARRLLLATGLFHVPPDLPGVEDCFGRSLFFCKDCDAYRVRGARVAVIGANDEAVEYALAMLAYTACVVIATNGKPAAWSQRHSEWIAEYAIPLVGERLDRLRHDNGRISHLIFPGGSVAVDCAFTTRGDIYHNDLARQLGAETDRDGQIRVNESMQTSVPGLYAAGCVTPANCQIIIAAGQGAAAAQAINRSLFEESLASRSLRQTRIRQQALENTVPEGASM